MTAPKKESPLTVLAPKGRPMNPRNFTVTENHIKLLERTYIGWGDWAYDGSPAVDPKRPFGNSDVERDIYEIIHDGKTPEGVDPDEFWDRWYDKDHSDLTALFREMEYVIQITVNLAGKGELIKPGEYRRPEQYRTREWARLPRAAVDAEV